MSQSSPAVLYPLLLDAALHVKVWGGRKLQTVLHKPLPTDEPYGEAWEMHDSATVANGPLAGRALGDLLAIYGAALIGPDNDPADGLPLLVKLIDAADWLSVQLHPNDEQAQQLEGDPRGKTEAWYVLAADPGAQLVIGVQPGTTREQMADAIRSSTLESLLVYADVTAGDVLFVRAGTIHALGSGTLIYEIQQSSDVTYRLYDWGRVGLDGQPRTLHIDKGTQVANLESLPTISHTGQQTAPLVEIVRNEYFITRRYHLDAGPFGLDTGRLHFHALTCIAGAASVEAGAQRVDFGPGRTVFMPASLGAYTLHGTGYVLHSAQA